MKKLLLISLAMCITSLSLIAQLGFNYQAVLRDTEGNPLNNQNVGMQISILEGSVSGNAIYSETFTTQTNNFGLVTLMIGSGTPKSGDFSTIDWSTVNYFIKIEVDATGGTSYTEMGTSQLLSVPYANYAFNGNAGQSAYETWLSLGNTGTEQDFINSLTGPAGTSSWTDNTETVSTNKMVGIGVDNPTSNLQIAPTENTKVGDPIFEIKNSTGKTVFAVYENDVKVFIDETQEGEFSVNNRNTENETSQLLAVTPDETTVYVDQPTTKETRGGFAISGRTSSKNINKEYLRITPTQTKFTIDQPTTKETRGGFAISGRTSSKGDTIDLLNITTGLTEIFVSEPTTKETRGGFAISGRTSSKESLEMMNITPSFTRFYVDGGNTKETRGGFAISGRTSSKGIGDEILMVAPNLTEVFVDENTSKETRGGFAISGRTSSKATGLFDIMHVQPTQTNIYIKESNTKNIADGFSISGLNNLYEPTQLFSVTETGTFVSTTLAIAPKLTCTSFGQPAQTTMYLEGAVTDTGSAYVATYGFIYSTTPTLNLNIDTTDQQLAGIIIPASGDSYNFYESIVNLKPGTIYYYCAFATNEDGATGYSTPGTYTTLAPYTLTFNITDATTNAPISDAIVTVEDIDYSFSATGSPGQYVFEVPYIGCIYQVSATGYQPFANDASTVVYINKDTTINVQLTPVKAESGQTAPILQQLKNENQSNVPENKRNKTGIKPQEATLND